MNMTPEQALGLIAQVVNNHLCNKQDRIILDQALHTLQATITKSKDPVVTPGS
jgi:hypothetical protein